MFTGLVEEVGKVISIGNGTLKVAANTVTEDVKIGDSIAVNGICLTVTSYTEDSFTVDVMPETVQRTALQQLSKDSEVNLERAMSANGRFGGHIVSGHIDGVGKVTGYKADGNAVWITVTTDNQLLRHIAPKGSITIDGVSLTVVDSLSDCFTVSLIPHTSSVTTLTSHKTGDIVNLETDVIAKYIDHILSFDKQNSKSSIDMEFLARCGF
jgi:riboflavin synthase